MINLIKSTFHKEVQTKKDLVKFIQKTKILSFSKECQKFERNFSRFQERKTCVFVNSGSSANLALIQALLNLGKISKGDKVGFSALTWSTNVMPLLQLGLVPVPVDVELDTLNVSSAKILSVLKTENIKMMFITNLLGFCDDIDVIKKICDERKIILIEDNCEGLGTVYRGKKLGNFGLASTYSFYVGHHMSTIEGGAVCTDSAALATQLRLVRAHGWDRNLTIGKQQKIRDKFKVNSTFYSRYTFYDLGYNLRPTEINGFIGNVQIKYLEEIILKRQSNFLELAKIIYKDEKYYPIEFSHIDRISNFAVPVICKTKEIRDRLVEKCNGKLEIRPIVGGDMTQQPFFEKHCRGQLGANTNARLIHEQGLYFGNNPEITTGEMKTIIKILTSL